MKKERRCLKFTGYIYLPKEDIDFNTLRYHAGRTPGRIIIYDEFGKRPDSKAIAFDNIGDMLAVIERTKQQRIYKIIKRKK